MPMNANCVLNVRTANDLNLEAFMNDGGIIKGLKNAQIRVDSKTFNVTFGENGNASVSWAHKSFWHLFQGGSKTAVKNKLQELYDNFRSESATRDFAAMKTVIVGMNKFTAVSEHAMQSLKGRFVNPGGVTEVAHYGFDTMRAKSQAGVMFGVDADQANRNQGYVRLMVINHYNEGIGISATSLSAVACVETMQRINRGLADKDLHENDGGFTKEKLASWANFLKGKDVDVFSKLQRAEVEAKAGKTTGWAGVINKRGLEQAALELVRKNLDGGMARMLDVNFVLEGVAKALVALSRVDRTNIGKEEWRNLVEEALSANVPSDKKELAWEVLDTVCVTAFFRQTSKLGLDYFKANNMPIVFDWTDHDGNDLSANGEAPVNDKWWKDPNAALDRHYGAAITFSEMRHVKKMEKAGQLQEDASLIRVSGMNEADVVAKLESQRRVFAGMDPAGLKGMVEGLQAAFEVKTLPSVKPMLEHFLISTAFRGTFADSDENGNLALNGRGRRAAQRALEQTKADYERLSDDINRALYLVNFATHLQSNFYATMAAEDDLNLDTYDRVEPPTAAELRLNASLLFDKDAAGLEHRLAQELAGFAGGRGMGLFFFGNGALNSLGQNLVDTLKREIRKEYKGLEGAAKDAYLDALGDTIRTRLANRIGELAEAFAAEFGLEGRDAAIDHPAFKSFLYRTAGSHDSLDQIKQKLPIVHRAYDLSVVAKNAFEQELGRLPEELHGPMADIVRRKLEWDMNRICFKLAQQNATGVNVRILQRVQTLMKFAQKAHQMADRVANDLHVALTQKQYLDIVSGYLERSGSKVHNVRLESDAKYDTVEVEQDDAAAVKLYDEIVKQIGEKGLPAKVVVGGLGEAFHNGLKPKLVARSFDLLNALQLAEIKVSGRNPKARVSSLIHELAKAMREAYAKANVNNDLLADELGPMLAFCCAAYLDQHPELAKDVEAVSYDESNEITSEITEEGLATVDRLLLACNGAILAQD